MINYNIKKNKIKARHGCCLTDHQIKPLPQQHPWPYLTKVVLFTHEISGYREWIPTEYLGGS